MENEVQIILQAVEQTKAAFDTAIGQIQKLNQQNTQSISLFQRATTAVNGAVNALFSMRTAITALVSALALRELVEFPAQMQRMAAVAGMNVNSFTALSGAAKKYDVDASQLTYAIKILGVAVTEALKGNPQRIAEFNALGISTQFLTKNQNDLSTIFYTVADAFQAHADGAEKSDLSQKLLGRSSQELTEFMNQGGNAMQDQVAHMKSLMTVTEDEVRQSKALKSAMVDLKTVLASSESLVQKYLPAVTDTVNLLVEYKGITLTVIGTIGVLTAAILAASTVTAAYVLVLTSLAAAFIAVKEGYKLWKAKLEEKSDADLLAQQQKDLKGRLDSIIDQYEQAGKISADKAKIMRRELLDALSLPPADAQKAIESVQVSLAEANGQSIKGAAGGVETKPPPFHEPDPALLKAQAKEKLDFITASLDEQQSETKIAQDTLQRQLDDSLSRQTISVENWVAQSKALNATKTKDEIDNLNKQTTARITELNAEIASGVTPAEKTSLQGEEINAKIETTKQINEINKQKTDRNFEIDKTALKATRQLYAQHVQDVQRAESESQSALKSQLATIDAQEKTGQLNRGQANQARAIAETEYLNQLVAEKAQLDAILADMLAINKASPGTFTPQQIGAVTAQGAATDKEMAGAKAKTVEETQGEWSAMMTKLQTQWGSWSQQTSEAFASTFNSAINSVSAGLVKAIEGAKNLNQAMRQIGLTILNEIITAIVQMGLRWIATQLMMAVFSKTLQTASTVTATAQAATLDAVWWTPAILSAIATAGTTAADAPALVAAAMGGFAEGGYTGGGSVNDVAGVVHGHEYVFDAGSVNKMGVNWFAGLHQSLKAGGSVAPVPRGGYAGGGFVEPGTPGGAGKEVKVDHFIVYNESQLWDKLKSSTARQIVITHLTDPASKMKIGLRT